MDKRKNSAAAKAADIQPAVDEILGLIKAFCREKLNEEYSAVCCRLAEKLARKRPSPLISGKPNVWACGIVRAIGLLNFLHDKTQRPYLKATDIDNAFGVSESTGSAKSTLIRKLLKIFQFDPAWTLPSHMDDNPRVWLVQLNGLLVDVRKLPLAVQEDALRAGVIPYIPGA